MKTDFSAHRILSIAPDVWGRAVSKCAEPAQSGIPTWDDVYPEPDEPYDAEGVSVVPINGVLCPNVTPFERRRGFADTALISQQVREAAANGNTSAILLHIQSPGGAVAGIPECGAIIKEASKVKPVCAFIDGVGASGAYWLACCANEILCQPSACVGSVGVYSVIYDTKKMFEAFGIQVQVFRSGKFKGSGIDGTTLTEDQAANVQAGVDRTATMFRALVMNARPKCSADMLEGQTFDGLQAVENGMADGLACDVQEVLEILKTS